MEKVVVIGMGYVGFPTACAIAKSGKYEVIGYDISQEKIDKINQKISPVDDELAEKDIKEVSLIGTMDSQCLKDAKFVLICVPTPIDESHNPDLGPIIGATTAIKNHLSTGQYIILESTVNPGVCDETIIPMLEETGLVCGVDFEVGHSPERINPGDKKWNVYNIPRNVGATTPQGTTIIAEFYRSFLHAEVNEMPDIQHAEATKILENSFRDVNIAFINEIAKSFDRLGLDVTQVIKGASTKPFAFMAHYPGCGVGGHCIAVDPYYLIEKARKVGFDHKFMKLAREINNGMPWYFVKKLIFELNKLGKCMNGTRVALLGLSYKNNIADLRESPSFEILKQLKKFGAIVDVYEPYRLDMSNSQSLQEVVSKNEVLVLATAHKEFVEGLNLDILEKSGVVLVMDGRNCLDKKIFKETKIIYRGIGR